MFKPALHAIAISLAALTVAHAAPAPASPAISAEKMALVQRVLAKMPMENIGLAMLQAPVAESLRQANSMLQGRATPDKQEAAMRDINAEAGKFLEETMPTVRKSTQNLLGSTVVPLLAQRFSDDELRQLAALLESPVRAKFEAMAPELQKAVGEKLSAATQAQINPKLADLQQRIGLRMRSAITP